jgi:hypothetical protein
MNDSRFTSSPIHAPNHELEEMEIMIPLISVVNKRIFVELLSIRMESVYLYLWGISPLAFLALVHFGVWSMGIFYTLGSSLILFYAIIMGALL